MKRVRWNHIAVLVVVAAAVVTIAKSYSSPVGHKETASIEEVGTDAKPVPTSHAVSERQVPVVPARAAAFAIAEPIGGSIFDSPSARDGFQTGMKRVTGSLSATQAQERFAELGVDTEANKTRALQFSKVAYSPGREREDVRKKVLAQYFLMYSARFSQEECTESLSVNMALVRSNAADKDLQRAYALDVLAFAKICARKDFASVNQLAQGENDPLVRSQLLSALESVNEEKRSPNYD